MLPILYLIALLPLLYSLNLPPVGQHDHSLTLIHLQALGILRYASHPPTLPFVVKVLYKIFPSDYRIVRLLTVLFAPLFPISAWMLGKRYGKRLAYLSYLMAMLTPLYLIYGKAPIYALFGFSLGSLALSMYLSGRKTLSHILSAAALSLDWTALPLVVPVLLDLRRRWKYAPIYLPAVLIYLIWLKEFLPHAGGEVFQRFPHPGDILLILVLVPLRLLLYLGPIHTLALYITIKRNNIPGEIKVPVALQMAFAILWADFYVHHTPYLLNFLPLMAMLSAIGIKNLIRTYGKIIPPITAVYSVLFAYLSLYPYRLFEASTVGCILIRLSRANAGVRVEIPEDRPVPKSVGVVLTMVNWNPESKTTLLYFPTDGRGYTLFGDTVKISGVGYVGSRCKVRDTTPWDRLILGTKAVAKGLLR